MEVNQRNIRGIERKSSGGKKKGGQPKRKMGRKGKKPQNEKKSQSKKRKQNAKIDLKQKLGGKRQKSGRAILKGDSCEYVELTKIINVDGCETGEDEYINHKSFCYNGDYRQEVCDWTGI